MSEGKEFVSIRIPDSMRIFVKMGLHLQHIIQSGRLKKHMPPATGSGEFGAGDSAGVSGWTGEGEDGGGGRPTGDSAGKSDGSGTEGIGGEGGGSGVGRIA